MKRILICILSLITCFCVASCVKKEKTEEKTVSMYDLRVAMLAADATLPEMMSVSSSDNNAAELFGYLSDFDYDKTDGFFLSYASDGMAYEIAVVAVKDIADVPDLKSTISAHVEKRVTLYKNYAPDQVEAARAAEIVTNGRYVGLIMCGEKDAVKKAFADGVSVKEENK